MMRQPKFSYRKQTGATLIVSLVMLLMLTLLTLSSMNSTILEEKMAGNYKDRNSAFQAAEAALRGGENYLRDTNNLPIFDGTTPGLYQPSSTGQPLWDSVNWEANPSQSAVYATGSLFTKENNSQSVTAPRYIIEELPAVVDQQGSLEVGVATDNRYFRVTSRATGNTSSAVVMLQSTYRK